MVYREGDRVEQANYGTGTVISRDDRHTVIQFDDDSTRRFSTPLVTLRATTTPAPVPVPKKRATSKRRSPEAGKTATE
jgi:hypothetical protein